MVRRLAILWLLLGLVAAPAGPAPAAGSGDEPESPGALAREGAERLMRALEALILMIPQFESPELTEDGDIIIRRKRPGDEGGPGLPDEPEPDGEPVPLGGPDVEETET